MRSSAPKTGLTTAVAVSLALLAGSRPAICVAERIECTLTPPPEIAVAVIGKSDMETVGWTSALVVLPPGHHASAARAFAAGGVERTARVVATTGDHGASVAVLQVDAGASPTLRLQVETEPGGPVPRPRLRSDAAAEARLAAAFRARVANPENVERWLPRPAAPPRPAKSSANPVLPAGDPSLDGAGVRYLIVTPEALVPTFETLAAWKRRRGIPAQIRTLEWILSRTRQGVDAAETLRNFLVEAYALWGVEYVLLGGDTQLIPARFAYSAVFGGSTTPTDMYYACLDGTWNGDGDSRWGEGGQMPNTSEADIVPELGVARAPVNNAAEAAAFVARIIDYERPAFTDYQTRFASLAEVLVPANWDSGETISYDGATHSQQFIAQSVPASFTVDRLYDTYWLHPGSTRLTRQGSRDLMNAGTGIVNQLGHGFRYTMSCGDGSLVNADADALTNAGRPFALFMANCAAGAFDYNCLAERFLLNPVGGAAVVIGATRSVTATLVVTYDKALFRQLFEHQVTRVSDLLNATRLERVALGELEGGDRWIQFCLNALGDPETPLFTGPVRVPAIAAPEAITVGPGSVAVTVTVDGQPVSGATVALLKDTDVYAVGATDDMGAAVVELAPTTPGMLEVVVSGPNLATRADTITVGPAPGVVLALGGLEPNEDSTPPSDGNGDGLLDAGETVELAVYVLNHGSAPADSVVATLLPGDPRVTILQNVAFAGAVSGGNVEAASPPFVIHLDASLADGTPLDLPVQFTDRTGGIWTDRVHFLACAPRTEVARISAVPGTGTVTLEVELANLGSGSQPAIVAVASRLDAGEPVPQDSMQFATIPPLVHLNGAPSFVVTDSAGTTPVVRVAFEDLRGRTFEFVCDGRAPAPPATPSADLTFLSGVVRLTWPPSTESDRWGYHVFRRAPGGDFVRITSDVIRHTDYYDTQVQANSHYDYYVVSVDASRQWSPPSPVLGVNTSAAALAGWPLELADPTASSVGVGDIDGDGRPEVVIGDNGVYAWHANGQEVADGDGNALTDGVLSSASGTMNASVALAAIDGEAGLEIVGASWSTNRVFVFDGSGQVLPGWPRQPSRGGNAGYWSSPAVGDVDGDGAPEIVAVSKDGNLYAWHADGTALLPQFSDGYVRTVGAWTQATPALADLDGDGQREIIVNGALARVFVLRADGSDFPGWPRDLFAFGKGSPAIGDLDRDGDLEIVITSESDHIWVFNTDGTSFPGWPKSFPSDAPDLGPSPALGDMDGDGTLEIVVCSVKSPFNLTKVYVLDVNGNALLTKSLELNSQSSPILADLNGDGSIDVVQAGESGLLHAWSLSGAEVAGFPIQVGDYLRGTPQYCDLDGDGGGDLVIAGWNKKVYAWKMTGPYRPDHAPWPTFHGDLARTGFLRPTYPTTTEPVPNASRLAAVWSPNPFNPTATVVLAVPGIAGAPVAVRIDVYDAAGRRVRRLADGPMPAGISRLTWDGRDDSGREQASGLYFYRVDAAGETLRGKLTLLR